MTEKERKKQRRIYNTVYCNTVRWMQEDRRASGATGPNSAERLEEIKRKYAGGVPEAVIQEMADALLEEMIRR